jgi:hypothetical protein
MWLDDILTKINQGVAIPAAIHAGDSKTAGRCASVTAPVTPPPRVKPPQAGAAMVPDILGATDRPIIYRPAVRPPIPASWYADPPSDDRSNCATCQNYIPPGCLACRRGLFSFRSRDHQPDPERLHRCFLYLPLTEDPDQSTGGDRWPNLAWQRRSPS